MAGALIRRVAVTGRTSTKSSDMLGHVREQDRDGDAGLTVALELPGLPRACAW